MTDQVSRSRKSASISASWVSFEGLRWATQQMSRTDLAAGPKLVLFAMAAHVRDDRWTVWPSQDRLAAACGMTRRGVQGAIDALVEAGIVAVERRHDDFNRDLPNVYRLMVDVGRTDCAPGRAEAPGEGEPISHEVQDPEVQRTSTTRARQQPLINEPALLVFPVVGHGGPEWPLTQSLVAELAELFPAVDVLGECRSALAWVRADLTRRKSAAGMRRFLTGWVTRSNDRPRIPTSNGKHAPTAVQALKRTIDASGAENVLSGLVDWPDEDLPGWPSRGAR